MKELFLEDGTKAGLLDICDWWCSIYPKDIFETEPYLIVEIRERMKKLLQILRPGAIKKE
jgi:hypothetical protein